MMTKESSLLGVKRFRFIIIAAALALAFMVCIALPSQVQAAAKPKVTITNAGSTHTVKKGSSLSLKVNVSPLTAQQKGVKWATSNKKIVTVTSKGKVKGIKAGTATITVTTKASPKKKDTVKVTVGTKVSSLKLANIATGHTIKKGEVITVLPTVAPLTASNQKIKWTTSNKKIISVTSAGVIKAVKKGVATITGTTTDGTNKAVKAILTVGTKVSKIKITNNLSFNNTVVYGGTGYALGATVTPATASNQTVTYKSSATSVLKVSSTGELTYVKPGTATVTATAKDGSGKTASITINTDRLKYDSTQWIGHRGLRSEAPENSIPSFMTAIGKGFWGVECDIWETMKEFKATPYTSTLVLSHDDSLSVMTGKNNKISESTWSEIKDFKITAGDYASRYGNLKLATLDDYLNLMQYNPSVKALIEVKQKELSEEAIDYIEQALENRKMTNRTIILSFYKTPLQKIEDAIPGIETTYLADATSCVEIEERISWAKKYKVESISTDYSRITNDMAVAIHGAGLKLGAYTVNDIKKAYNLIKESKADFITSDYILY